jgi:putative transposase
MDVQFCIEVLDQALDRGGPAIFNTDQGAQFTSQVFTAWLQKGGCGRVLDNVHVEWLWRSIKCEEVSQRDDQTVRVARHGLSRYLAFYNGERLHQVLGYRTPAEV